MAEDGDNRVLDYGQPPSNQKTSGQLLGGAFSGLVLTQLAICAGIYSALGIGAWAVLVGAACVLGIAIWGAKLRRRRSAFGAGVLIGMGLNALLWGCCYMAFR